jgi:uncharacterized delta-60 repeat protein
VALTPIGSNTFDRIYAIALQPDGKIVAVGGSTPSNSSSREVALVRYNANGTLDATFGDKGEALDHIATTSLVGGATERMGLAIDPGTGQIVMEAANPSSIPGGYPAMVIRYASNGTLDKSFGNTGTGYETFDGSPLSGLPAVIFTGGVAIQPADHRVVVVGRVVNSGQPAEAQALARLNVNGTLDGSLSVTNIFNTDITGQVATAKLQSDGGIVVGATGWNTFGSGSAITVARYNPDLSIDTSFGTEGSAGVANLPQEDFAGMALEPDGRIAAVGNPNGGSWRVDVARFLATGPQIDSLILSPPPSGSSYSPTLADSGITDGNPGAVVTQVAFFYFDSTGKKVTLGTGIPDGLGKWTIPVDLPSGTTVYAQALDSLGALGDPVSISL